MPNEESFRVWGVNIEDRYVLSNFSTKEKIMEVIYPFVGSFNELQEQIPVITVNGQEVLPTMYAGGYSGEFVDVYGEDDSDGSFNIFN